MSHCISTEAEKILDKPFPVLDKGFVRLVDYLGNDSRIVQSARVSYGEGTKTVREDAALIDYLLRNDHTSPFEQVVLTFHVKMPIFVARQWIRHRTARINEISGRYSIMKNECYVPASADIALQSSDNKQGRAADAADGAFAQNVIDTFTRGQQDSFAAYDALIESDLAREIARINLPLSLYTELYWQIDLHNLFHFLALRLDGHAQKEIRDYAQVLLDITEKVAPAAVASFKNIKLNGKSFSGAEMEALRALLAGNPSTLSGKAGERFLEKLNGA